MVASLSIPMKRRESSYLLILGLPALAVFAAFFLLPLGKLAVTSLKGQDVFGSYLAIITSARYRQSLLDTVALAVVVTFSALAFSTVAALFLQRNEFPGRRVLTALLTLPLAFPGVVVGFMVILLGGRQGLVASISHALTGVRIVFAYSLAGLYVGYLYFSIPRVIVTVMAAVEKLDPSLEEAARSLGASSWQVARDVIVPALRPALTATGAICFATAMGAFGTAFTLATNIDVLPMTIYTEFTLSANVTMAAALSLVLGAITWAVLYLSRSLSGQPMTMP